MKNEKPQLKTKNVKNIFRFFPPETDQPRAEYYFIFKNEKGAAMLISVFTILFVGLIISASFLFLGVNTSRITRNLTLSLKSYYVSEAGIEDIILRMSPNSGLGLPTDNPNILTIGDYSASRNIGDPIGGTRLVVSTGDANNRIRKVRLSSVITTEDVSFFYGAQVDKGGLSMGNNAEVAGNVFSNGSILPLVGGMSDIIGTAKVAINGNKIESARINGDAYVHTCKDSDITGTLYYVSGGSIQNCNYGALVDLGPNEIEKKPLPISEDTITGWENNAALGGILPENYVLDGKVADSLGPIQIGTLAEPRDMTLDNKAILTVEGTIYVTGNVFIQNGATIKLDSSYGSTSGVVVVDGKINLKNNAVFRGSGQEGSYIMLLSTSSSLDPDSPAMDIDNNAEAAIFYTTQGAIFLHNNIEIREVTGYKIILDNNAVVEYEVGLEDVNFSGGPGGGWSIAGWQETY